MSEKQKKKNKGWRILISVFVIILLLADTAVIFSMWNIMNKVDQYNHGVVDEIGDITGNIHKFANDLNEIRGFLLLPKTNYFSDKPVVNQLIGERKSSLASQAIYAFLAQYQKNKNFQRNKTQVKKWLTEIQNNFTNQFNSMLMTAGLRWGKENDTNQLINLKFTNETGANLFGLILNFQSDDMKVQSILGEKNLGVLNNKVLIDYLTMNKKIVESKQADLLNKEMDLNKLMKTKDITDLLKERHLVVANVYQNKINGYYKEIEQNGKMVLSIGIKRLNFIFVLANQEYKDIVLLKTALINTLKNLDLRTDEQKIFDAKKTELERIMREQAFQDLISQMNLKVQAPREGNNKIVYDLIDKNTGQVKFSLVVEESSGHLKLIENNQEIDLEDYQINSGSKKNF